MKKRTTILALLSAILTPATMLIAQTPFDIEDTFQSGSQGTPSPLEGSQTSAGGATWTATKNVLLNKDGEQGYITTADSRVYRANVPLPSKTGSITVSGVVKPDEGAERKNWVGIGLCANNMNFTWEQGLLLMVDSGGSFEAMANTPSKGLVRLKRDKIPDYEEGKPVKLAVEYDPAGGTVTFSVNDVPVLAAKALEDDQKPLVECAGFSGFAPKPGSPTVFRFRAFTPK